MNTQQRKNKIVQQLLQGVWVGHGCGDFPTLNRFAYRETLTFRRHGATTLLYEQRTDKRLLGQATYQPSHTESGFLRFLPSGKLAWVNIQGNGRWEIMAGFMEVEKGLLRLTFSSQDILNDERVLASSRAFELRPYSLQYQMSVQTKDVNQLTHYLMATLHRTQ